MSWVKYFFEGLSRLGRLHPDSDPARHGLEVVRDIPYLDDGQVAHRLDVWRPIERRGPLPSVLYLHGGGFHILSKESHWIMALALARRGYAVFNANYRLSGQAPYPAAVEDAAAALAWVVANADRFGGDPQRLVVAGESAGANLATALAVMACYRRDEPPARQVWALERVPVAVVAMCGILQVSDPGRFMRRRTISRIFNARLLEVSRLYLRERRDLPEAADPALDLADPLRVLERGQPPDRPLPTFLATVGTHDPLLDDTRRLKVALDRLGTGCEARYYPGELHAFQALVWRKQAKQAWRDTYDFLDRVLA